jgi:hypothetical protein
VTADRYDEHGLEDPRARCVTGETRIWVNGRGLVQTRELVGLTPEVATLDAEAGGVVFRAATQVVNAGTRPVVKITTREGIELRLTADHRVTTDKGEASAGELRVKDRLRIALAPAVSVNREAPKVKLAELVGWLTASGNFDEDRATLAFRHELQDSNGRLSSTLHTFVGGETNFLGGGLRYEARLFRMLADVGVDANLKRTLPEWVWRGSLEVIVGYLRGVFTAAARIEHHTIALYLPGDLKQAIQQLLLRCGIRSAIGGATRKLDPYLSLTQPGLRTFADSIGFLERSMNQKLGELLSWIDAAATETTKSTRARSRRPPEPTGNDEADAAAFAAYASQFDDILEANAGLYGDENDRYEARELEKIIKRGRELEEFEQGWSTVHALERQGEELVFDVLEPSTGQFFANGLLVRCSSLE